MYKRRLAKHVSAAAIFLVLLGGCGESYDRFYRTDFVSADNGGFRFKAVGDMQYPVDSQDGEARRRRMLDEWLKINAMCATGYRIEKRTPIVKNVGVFGDKSYDVWYEGRCT